MFRRALLAAVALAALAVSPLVHAAAPIPQLDAHFGVNGEFVPVAFPPPEFDPRTGFYSWVLPTPMNLPGGARVDSWNVVGDPDPLVSQAFAVTNFSGVTQAYSFQVDILIPALAGPTNMGASTSGSLTDADFNGVGALTDALLPICRDRIDGVAVINLLVPPQLYVVPFAGGSATVGPDSAGLPGLTVIGPAVATSIGINHTFTLTPGDQASFTSVFRVEVPEPGTLSLAAGAVGLLIRRRRA